MLLRKTHPLLKIMNGVLVDLPSPPNISTFWNYGSLLGFTLVLQLITGLLLAARYSGGVSSFESVISIYQDVNYGWLLRLFHSTGASLFFLFIYMHIGRGLYYGSFKLKEVWTIGVLIYLILMGTAFLGYVLPWGQMSYWAATVITNLLSAIPYFGSSLVQWVWGGFAVSTPTLTRFYMLHYLLPFVLVFLSALHIFYLHVEGSSNPLGLNSSSVKVPFHYFYAVKDLVGIVLAVMVFLYISFVYGYAFMDSENFIPANPLVTPTHIQPEWYFLFAYAILRSIPNKLGGVVAFVLSVVALFFFPLFKKSSIGGVVFSNLKRFVFWFFVANFFILTWLGMMPAEVPFTSVSGWHTLFYFLLLTVFLIL